MQNTRGVHAPARRQRSRPGARAATIAFLLLGFAAAAGAGRLVGLTWNNPSGGSASTATNWTPNQVPTANDDLTFALANTFSVTFDNLTTASRSHTYRRGFVTLTNTAPHSVGTGVTVGDLAGDVATTRLTTGDLTAQGAVVLGDAAGATGTLRVDDDDAELILTGSAGDLTVGNNGAGTLAITGGGLVRVGDRFVAGSNSSGTATVTVSGRLGGPPFTRSTLEVEGTSQAAAIGAGGDVSMTVTDGGLASYSGSVNVAQGSLSVSTLTIGGGGAFATAEVGGDLGIARNSSAGSAAGFGVVQVDQGGVLQVAGTINVGNDPDGGTAFLRMDTGASITTGSLAVGANGEFDLDGGFLSVDGGAFSYAHPSIPLLLAGPDGPELRLENGAAASLDGVVSGEAIVVGGGVGANAGTLTVLSGADLTIASGDVVIGETSDDIGVLRLSGAGSTLASPTDAILVVGEGGAGEFFAELGAAATLGRVQLGLPSGSAGAMIVSGPGTIVTCEDLFVGGAVGGTGTLSVTGGGACRALGDEGVEIRPAASLLVAGATLEATDRVLIEGAATIDAGTITANLIEVHSFVTASGSLAGEVFIEDEGGVTAGSGDLALGDPASPNGVIGRGSLDCVNRRVTLHDQSEANLRTVHLTGGTLAAQNGVTIIAGGTLTGAGTIECDLRILGEVVSVGSGLTCKGRLLGPDLRATGEPMRFVEGGGVTGGGRVDAPIEGDSSSFVPVGFLELGTGSPSVEIDGAILVGPVDTLLFNPGALLGGDVSLVEGGRIVSAGFVELTPGSVTQAAGSFHAAVLMHPASQVRATGPLTLGNGAFMGFRGLGGILEVGEFPVTFLASNPALLPPLTTLAGGSMTSASGFISDLGDTLRGWGTVLSPFSNDGVLDVGDPLGAITFAGGLDLRFDSVVALQLGGVLPLSGGSGGAGGHASGRPRTLLWDQIFVTGTAELGGTLRIGQVDGIETEVNDRFTLIDAGSIEGTFDGVVFESAFLADLFEVTYTSTKVILVARATVAVGPPPKGDGYGTAAPAPREFALRLAGANPFRADGGAVFEYDVPRDGSPVTIAVFDMTGRRVAELLSGTSSAGRHQMTWGGSHVRQLHSGVYLVLLRAPGFEARQRVVLLR